MKVKTLLSLSSFSLKLKEKWVALARADEVLNNNSISKPHRLKSCGFHLPLLEYQGEAVLVLAGFLSTLLIPLLSTTPTSAVTCDPTNTQAPSCISISLSKSFTPSNPSATNGSCGDGTSNICMDVPDGGGIVTGGHTMTAWSNAVSGYWVSFKTATDTRSLTNQTDQSEILSVEQKGAGWVTLDNNHYGIAVVGQKFGVASDKPYNTTDQSVLASAKFAGIARPTSNPEDGAWVTDSKTTSAKDGDKTKIYYGVRIDDPKSMTSGGYSNTILYTATARPAPAATISSLTPATAQKSDVAGQTTKLTITGSNLATAYNIYLQLPSDIGTENNKIVCTNITPNTDGTSLTCDLPTSGDAIQTDQAYDLYVQTQAAELGKKESAFTYTPSVSICQSGNPKNDCQVDIDYPKDAYSGLADASGMIPIKYVGDTTNAKWAAVYNYDSSGSQGEWYDYGEKKWANAVTMKTYGEADRCYKSNYVDDYTKSYGVRTVTPASNCYGSGGEAVYTPSAAAVLFSKAIANGAKVTLDGVDIDQWVIPEAEIKGYWVYIPRYNYQIQTTTVSNAKLAKDFEIKFQKSTDQKLPKEANTEPAVGDWVTHPAFTWGDKELNGIWVGKFETTGSTKSPTILPNQYHKANEYIGVFYDIAKSIGVNNPANTYGNGTATTQNSHNLNAAKTHMLKNSEWGAVAYLSSSKYGAGVNNVQLNTSTDRDTGSDGSILGITGCGPYADGSTSTYGCSGKADHQYQSTLGQLASTTNNIYGIYDMAGGAYEYVMGNWTDTEGEGSMGSADASFFTNLPIPPYVDLYLNITDNGRCTWLTCGGDALYETASWGSDYPYFVTSTFPWFNRGGSWANGFNAGLFNSNINYGNGNDLFGFRVSLLVQ